MSTPDPFSWQEVASWLWAVLLVPIVYVWKKATGAISRQELREHLDDDKEAHVEIRETMKTLFENAEEDRRRSDERFSKMQDVIHKIHIEVIERLSRS